VLRPDVDASALRSLPDIVSDVGPGLVPDGEPRLLAARLLEHTLLQLGRAGTVVERRLASGLSRMHGRRLYLLLGYVRLADYLTERLGMSLRRCQAILRLERALARLPRLARALAAGEVSVSKLEVAADVATAETETAWLERARRLPLASLREAARQAGGGATEFSAAPASSAASAPSDAPSLPAAPALPTAPASPIEQEEPGRVITFNAPAPVVGIWHWTLDLVRRVAGQQEPTWRCAEFLAAEFLSGVPDTAGNPPSESCAHDRDPRDCDQVRGPRPSTLLSDSSDALPNHSGALPTPSAPLAPRHAGDTAGKATWIEVSAAVREALASIGASADPEAILAERPAAGERVDPAAVSPDDEVDAWELDARLRRLVRLRQSLAWRQGRLLATLVSLRLHRDLGFDTFDEWAGDRSAMSPRRARYLVSLARRLRSLPLLADVYRRGLVSWCQVRLLVRVVRPATQSRWIRYARRVTVRRLEDAIVACEVSAATSSATPAPTTPAHIGAAPLPPAEPPPAETKSLPRDHAPRHTSAPVDTATFDPTPADPAPADPAPALTSGPALSSVPDVANPLHTSAPARGSWPDAASPLHTSAPHLDLVAITRARSDRRTWRRISFWCPLDVASLWDSALRSCRAAAGNHLEDWECFLLLVQAMRDTWENQEDPHWRRRYRVLERDGWRCKAPGCTSRSGLNEHHITFRSQQGCDDAANLVTLCVGHHQQGLHEGRIRCFGRAPDGLWWDMGVRPGGEPLVRYFGDRLVGRRPFIPVIAFPRAVRPPVRVAASPASVAAPPAAVAASPASVAAPPAAVATSPACVAVLPPPVASSPPLIASATAGAG